MACTDIVEVILEDVVATDVALGIDHRVGILLTVFANIFTSIFKIGVEHTFQFDTHHIAPFGLCREVEKVTLRHAFHLRVGEPLAIVLVWFFVQNERSVDEKIVEVDVASLSASEITRLNTIELAVLHLNIVNVGVFVETDNLHTVLGLLTGDVLHVNVADGRIVSSATDLIMFIVEVDLQYTFLADANLDILHIDVLDDTTSTGIRFDTKYALQLRRVHHAVMCKDILAAAGYLRADDHTTVTVFHLAMADDDVLRWHIPFPAVTVAAALDGDTVVAGIEEAVFDEYAIAALGVAAITVGAIIDHLHSADCDVGRVEGMDHPERRAQQSDILQQDTLTLVERYELGPQTIGRTETALRCALTFFIIHGDTVLTVLQQTGTGFDALTDHTFFPAKAGIAVPWPPCLHRAAAVNSTLTRDGDVLSLEGIDAGR